MKLKLNIAKNFLIGILLLTSVISCQNAKKDWEKACQENTIASYEAFLNNNTDTTYLDSTIQKIWDITLKENTIQLYEDFLTKYPKSLYVDQAVDSVWRITEKKNNISDCENFLNNYPNTSLNSKVNEKIKKLFISITPPTPNCQLNSNLSVNITFGQVESANSYIIYWSSSKNGKMSKSNSQSLNETSFEHWPDNFPRYYRIVAIKGDNKSQPSEACKSELLSSKGGGRCQICGGSSVGYCHLRDIYVCSDHNTYTSKEGTNWRCP